MPRASWQNDTSAAPARPVEAPGRAGVGGGVDSRAGDPGCSAHGVHDPGAERGPGSVMHGSVMHGSAMRHSVASTLTGRTGATATPLQTSAPRTCMRPHTPLMLSAAPVGMERAAARTCMAPLSAARMLPWREVATAGRPPMLGLMTRACPEGGCCRRTRRRCQAASRRLMRMWLSTSTQASLQRWPQSRCALWCPCSHACMLALHCTLVHRGQAACRARVIMHMAHAHRLSGL